MRPPPPPPPLHFFKFIPPPLRSQLSLPESFIKHLSPTNKNKFALLKRGVKKWRVKITKDWVLAQGWENFVRENGVKEFDFVVFKHRGDMVFETMVFDSTRCEREYPPHLPTAHQDFQEPEYVNASKKIPKGKGSHIKRTPKSTRDGKYPCFKIHVSMHTLRDRRLHIPVEFAKSNGLHKRNCEMILRDEQQRLWPVELRTTRTGGRTRYQVKNLRALLNANGVKKGDELCLQLVQNAEKPLMNFHKIPKLSARSVVHNERTPSSAYDKQSKAFKSCGTAKTQVSNRRSKPIKNFVISQGTGVLMKRNTLSHIQYLPKKFAIANGLSHGEMIIKNVGNGGSWTVELARNRDKFYCLSHGWKDFCLANGLEAGDCFRFELVENGEKPVLSFSLCSERVCDVKRIG